MSDRPILTEEHEAFRRTVRSFIEKEVAPHHAQWEQDGQVSREVWTKAGAQGLLCFDVDEAYGGPGVRDFRYNLVLAEEMTKAGAHGPGFPVHTDIIVPYLSSLGTDEQKQRWLTGCVSGETITAIAMTEPGAGSDLQGIRTSAVDKGDHYVLNGSKTFISNGILSDLVIVVARTDPDAGHQGISLLVVERGMEGFERGRNLDKIGLKAQDTSELFFDNVKVPKANVLGDPTRGFYYLTQFLAEERLITACQCITNAQIAYDLAYDYITNRRVFGRPLGALQNARFKMAEMRAQIDVLQTFIDHCVTQHNAGKLTPQMAAEGKLLASELEGRVVDDCLQMHGGAGYMEEFRISRMFTDARVSRIYAGASEVMKEIIARGVGLDDRKMK